MKGYSLDRQRYNCLKGEVTERERETEQIELLYSAGPLPK